MIKDFLSHCLEKDPSRRYTAEQLLQHEWITSMTTQGAAETALPRNQLLEIGQNAIEFNRTSRLQSSIICFLVGLRRNKEDIAQLRKLFQAIDTNHDGFITLDEMQNSLKAVQKSLGSELSMD